MSRIHLDTAPPALLVFLAALLWSTGGLFIKASSLSAYQISFGRCAFAAITVALVTRRAGFGFNPVTGVAAVIYAIVLLLFVMATKMTTAANAIFLQYTAPIYVMLLEPVVYKEKFKLKDLVTVILCLCGMSLFFLGRLNAQDLTGNVIAIICGAFFGIMMLLLRAPGVREVNPASSVLYGNILLALFTLPSFTGALGAIGWRDLAIISYLGIFQLGLSYVLFTLGLARGLRSVDAAIICYIEPVLNPLWVFLVLGERPSVWAITGGTLIIITVFVHSVRNARAKKPVAA
ncbi:MAG: DMT family transporter [Pyrinomonadaceae bacterium]